MFHNVKVVIGANYGDEGKGLMASHYAKEANGYGARCITVLHNGTAQRGHTVDYLNGYRHVYHHFSAGTLMDSATYFANTFLLHPMTFAQEYKELSERTSNIICYYDPDCEVITPFDMAVDHATMAYIQKMNGEREHGTCGFGSWCATDRINKGLHLKIFDFKKTVFYSKESYDYIMAKAFAYAVSVLDDRKIDLDKIPEYKKYFEDCTCRISINDRFYSDINTFFSIASAAHFDTIWKIYPYIIFENGQGLGLDKDVDNDWHTTSKTGLYNPYNMIKDKEDFDAEVCYVTRSYLTRHGVGPLEEAVAIEVINHNMVDFTNAYNEFQGTLRYGFIESNDQRARIAKDFAIAATDNRFHKKIAVTHCNEFNIGKDFGDYFSDNRFGVEKRT